jgi:hypothetical protein
MSGHFYAGYYLNAVPPAGGNEHVRIVWNTTTLHVGFVAAFAGIHNGDGNWIQAGLNRAQGNSSIAQYIEYSTPSQGYHFFQMGLASAGTAYNAYIYKVSAGVWTASIGGNSLGYNVGLSNATGGEFMGEAYNGTPYVLCNVMDVNFSNASTYTTDPAMSQGANWPYHVESVTTAGWRSHGS